MGGERGFTRQCKRLPLTPEVCSWVRHGADLLYAVDLAAERDGRVVERAVQLVDHFRGENLRVHYLLHLWKMKRKGVRISQKLV